MAESKKDFKLTKYTHTSFYWASYGMAIVEFWRNSSVMVSHCKYT